MYCKECGMMYTNEEASYCLSCGVKKGNGNKYCSNCGTPRKSENQDVCLNCGKDFRRPFGGYDGEKLKLVTLLLAVFIGSFGVHQFYVGKNQRGILYIVLTILGVVTLGMTTCIAYVLVLIDIVKILLNKFKDSDGNIIERWL